MQLNVPRNFKKQKSLVSSFLLSLGQFLKTFKYFSLPFEIRIFR